MKVYVAVNLDLGWNNILGVYDSYEKAESVCKPTQEELDGPDGDWYKNNVHDRTGLYDLHHIHCKEVE